MKLFPIPQGSHNLLTADFSMFAMCSQINTRWEREALRPSEKATALPQPQVPWNVNHPDVQCPSSSSILMCIFFISAELTDSFQTSKSNKQTKLVKLYFKVSKLLQRKAEPPEKVPCTWQTHNPRAPVLCECGLGAALAPDRQPEAKESWMHLAWDKAGGRRSRFIFHCRHGVAANPAWVMWCKWWLSREWWGVRIKE